MRLACNLIKKRIRVLNFFFRVNKRGRSFFGKLVTAKLKFDKLAFKRKKEKKLLKKKTFQNIILRPSNLHTILFSKKNWIKNEKKLNGRKSEYTSSLFSQKKDLSLKVLFRKKLVVEVAWKGKMDIDSFHWKESHLRRYHLFSLEKLFINSDFFSKKLFLLFNCDCTLSGFPQFWKVLFPKKFEGSRNTFYPKILFQKSEVIWKSSNLQIRKVLFRSTRMI